jgi:hypothetical protein
VILWKPNWIAGKSRGLPLSFRPNKPFRAIIDDLELSTGLQLCLDAGDIQSYDGSSQTWIDRGQGNNFFLGTTSGAEASDPTFNGVAGTLTENEYFSLDGGDVCTIASGTNPDWLETFHKDNATLTVICYVKFGSLGTSVGIVGNTGLNTTGTGFYLGKTAANLLTGVFLNAGVVVLQGSISPAIETNVWYFCAVSLDENNSSTGFKLQLNSSLGQGNGTFVLPSSSNAFFPIQVASRGNADSPLPSGSQVGAVMVWNRALSAPELRSLYQYPGVSFSTEDSLRTVKRVVGY